MKKQQQHYQQQHQLNKYKENKVEQTSMGFRPMYDNMFGLLLLDYRLRNN